MLQVFQSVKSPTVSEMTPSKLVAILRWIPATDTEKIFLFLMPLQNFVSLPVPKATLKWNCPMFAQLKKLSRHPHRHLFSSGINSMQRETKRSLSLVNYTALFWHALCWFISQNCIYSDCSWHSADLCCTSHHTSLLGEKKKNKCSCVETKLHFHNYLEKLSRLVFILLAATFCLLSCRKKTRSPVILHQRSLPYQCQFTPAKKVPINLSTSPCPFHSWSIFLFFRKWWFHFQLKIIASQTWQLHNLQLFIWAF